MHSSNIRAYAKAATQYIIELTEVIENQNTDKQLIKEFFRDVSASGGRK